MDNESSNQRNLRVKNREKQPQFLNSPQEKVLDYKEELRRKLAMDSSKPVISRNEEEKVEKIDNSNLLSPTESDDGKDDINYNILNSPLNENFGTFEEIEKNHKIQTQKFLSEMDSIHQGNQDVVGQFINNFESEDGDNEIGQSFGSARMSNKEINFDPQVINPLK